VIALNPGIDPVAAAPILHAALEGKPYSTISCPRSKTELDAVGTELQRLFESHQLDSNGYGGYIDVLSCTYLAEGGFPPDSVAALHARFGEALTIVDGLHMSLLMPEVSPTP